MTLIEESDLEPHFPKIINEYSEKMTEYNIKNQDPSIFKNNIPIKRETPYIDFQSNNK